MINVMCDPAYSAEEAARGIARIAKQRKDIVLAWYTYSNITVPLIAYPNMGNKEIIEMLEVAAQLVETGLNGPVTL